MRAVAVGGWRTHRTCVLGSGLVVQIAHSFPTPCSQLVKSKGKAPTKGDEYRVRRWALARDQKGQAELLGSEATVHDSPLQERGWTMEDKVESIAGPSA